MRKLFQIALFALLIGVLVSLSTRTAQSSPPTNQPTATPISRAVPLLQAPGTLFQLYFPIISRQFHDLAIAGVQVIQGTIPSSTYATYIAGRPTMVRVLVSVDDGSSVPGVTGRMYGYDGSGNLLGSLNSTNTITAPSNESSMATSLNFDLPSAWLQPGFSYYVDVNPDGAILENRGNDRYPASGRAAINFSNARPLTVVIVPIFYLPSWAQNPFAPAGAYDNNYSYLTSLTEKVFPVPNVHYIYHTQIHYVSSTPSDDLNGSNGWFNLLQIITNLRNSESEDPYPYDVIYYGLVNYYDAHGCIGSCTIGVGWIGLSYDGQHYYGATSVGWTGDPNGGSNAANTLIHEMGHNFNREHAQCSTEGDVDLNYPYSGGFIGAWGLDVATGELKNPATYYDFMSYCEPVWTSDYTFAGIAAYRISAGVTFDQARLDQRSVPALYVSGTIAPDGSVTLRPVYQQTARVNLAAQGTHTLELLGDGGKVLAAFPFTPQQIADSNGASGFAFFVPAVDGLMGLRVKAGNRTIKEKTVAAPMAAGNFARQPLGAQRDARGTILRWTPVSHPTEPVVYRVRLSRDGGATWQVLALDSRSAEYAVPPGLSVANAMIEVQASDGIHTTTQTFTVGGNP